MTTQTLEIVIDFFSNNHPAAAIALGLLSIFAANIARGATEVRVVHTPFRAPIR